LIAASAHGMQSATPGKSCRELLAGIGIAVEPPKPRGFVLGAVSIPKAATKGAYEIRFDEGPPIVTSDLAQVVTAAVSRVADGQPVYFDVSGLPATRQVAFEKSLEVASARASLRTRVVKDLGPLGDPAQPLKEVVMRSPVQEGTGKNAGRFSQSADATVGNTSFSVRVTSRIRQVVIEFFQRLQAVVAKKGAPRSTISIVNDIRAELARKHNMSEDEIFIEFSNAVGKTLLVQLQRDVL
jgi:hypothetical protein